MEKYMSSVGKRGNYKNDHMKIFNNHHSPENLEYSPFTRIVYKIDQNIRYLEKNCAPAKYGLIHFIVSCGIYIPNGIYQHRFCIYNGCVCFVCLEYMYPTCTKVPSAPVRMSIVSIILSHKYAKGCV